MEDFPKQQTEQQTEEFAKQQPESSVEQQVESSTERQAKGNVGSGEKIKKKNKNLIIIICVCCAVVIIGLIVVFSIINTYQDSRREENNNSEVKEEPKKRSSLEKLKTGYESGELGVGDYFEQLVYLEFDSSSLDSKYVSDYKHYNTVDELNIEEILDEHYDELDEDVVKFYLENKLMANVSLGDDEVGMVPHVKLAKSEGEEEMKNAATHSLNKVSLSPNEHFLIWYADTGDDAISKDQLESIASGLESSIGDYERDFGIEYSYDPYVENKYFNEDYKNAKEILARNNIPESILDNAMSVYVYDTGSNGVLASYNDQQDLAKIINRSLIFDFLDEDGIVNYPYIIINKRGILDSNDSLKQIYNHELFHHMQYLFCESTSDERCVADVNLTEGMANFASAIVSNISTTDNFLNDWAGIYTSSTSTKLSEMANATGSLGYAIFPYLYEYSMNVDNWAEVLMNAHNEEDPFKYIQNNTTGQDLKDTINSLAEKTVSQEYDNKSLISNEGITFREELKEGKAYKFTIGGGAIDYFELDTTADLKATTNDSEYITMKIYGYKDGKYTELKSSSNEIEVDTAFYARYDKFYLAVTNADLTTSHNYEIILGNTKYADNSSYVTSFNNYAIDVTINMTMRGMDVSQHSEGVVDELHQKEYLESDTDAMGMVLSNKMYYDFDAGYTYMTQPYGGDVWWKEKGTSQMVDMKMILDKLTNMENVTKISDDHFKVKLTEEDVRGLMNSTEASGSAVKGDIEIDVYTKDGYVIKLEYDFSGKISNIETFTAVLEFSNYDKAGNVEIPQTIIDNAKNM